MNILDVRFDVRDGAVIVQIQREAPIDPCRETNPSWHDAQATDILDIAEVLRQKYATGNAMQINRVNPAYSVLGHKTAGIDLIDHQAQARGRHYF